MGTAVSFIAVSHFVLPCCRPRKDSAQILQPHTHELFFRSVVLLQVPGNLPPEPCFQLLLPEGALLPGVLLQVEQQGL